MALFTRRERPPADVLAVVPSSERVLSWADTDTGTVVLATPVGLWWPNEDGLRRIGWQHVDKAVWRDGSLVVTEAEVLDDELLVEQAPVAVHLAVPRDLPPTVRARVEANVVRSQLHAVTGGSARFVARRIPGRDGLVWWARLEPGTSTSDLVRAEISARLLTLRTQTQTELEL